MCPVYMKKRMDCKNELPRNPAKRDLHFVPTSYGVSRIKKPEFRRQNKNHTNGFLITHNLLDSDSWLLDTFKSMKHPAAL